MLNTARQSGGALGTAVLGALLTVGGSATSLRVPMAVVIAAYAGAIVCTLLACRAPNSDARPHPGRAPCHSEVDVRPSWVQ